MVARADARAVVAVEVLVEQQMIAPVWIVGELRRPTVHRPLLVPVEQEDIDHPAGDVARDRLERDLLAARAQRLDEVAGPERGAEFAQRLNDEERRGEP